MNVNFYKYQGTGNDFVMIDNRTNIFPKQKTDIISHICDRHFGIGADGIILIENDDLHDFKMIYFNADGSETFCGNGGRCAVAFAKRKSRGNHKIFAQFCRRRVRARNKDKIRRRKRLAQPGAQCHCMITHTGKPYSRHFEPPML